jgi:hypothetical protein
MDALELRIETASRYGQVLTYGGCCSQMSRAMRRVKRLARVAGLSVEQVVADVQEDYRTIEEIAEEVR